MIGIIVIIYFVSILISLPGLFSKAGYSFYKAFIPIYNLYILIQILDIKPIFLMLVAIALIFLNDRVAVATGICIFLPFMIADAYNKNFFIGLLGFILPFFIFPYIGYFSGTYIYDMEDC